MTRTYDQENEGEITPSATIASSVNRAQTREPKSEASTADSVILPFTARTKGVEQGAMQGR